MLRTARFVTGSLICAALGWMLLWGGCAKEEQSSVAISLDGRSVPAEELVALYDKIHGPNHWRNDSMEQRREFAELVGKKELLVRHARELMKHELPRREVIIRARWLEKQAMNMYWPRARTSVEIPQTYIDSLSQAMIHERYLRHVVSQDRALVEQVIARLKAGEEMKAVAAEYTNQSADALIHAEVGWVSRPMLTPEISAVLYDELQADGDVGGPVQSSYGWHAVQLGGIRDVAVEEVPEQALESMKEFYRGTVIRKRIAGFKQHYNLQVIDENLGPIVRCFNAMHDSLNQMKMQGLMPDYQGLEPPLHRFTPEERALPLVNWVEGVLTVGDFVKNLGEVDLDYWPTTGDAARIRAQIDRTLSRWMMTREANKDGALEDPELVRELRQKEDELYLDAYYRQTLAVYRDAVNDQDVQSWWGSHQDKYMSQDLAGYGYLRFPTDLRDLAWQIYEQLRGGAQWPLAASEARKRDARVDFENGLDPTSGPPYPQITAAAMRFAPQPDGTPTITEPLEIGTEWVILRVTFRSEPNTLSFEEAAPFVRRDLQRQILEDSLSTTLDDLSKRYGLKIHEAALR